MTIEIGDVFKQGTATMRIICVDRKSKTSNTIVGLLMNTDDDSISERTVVVSPHVLEHTWSKVTPWDDFEIDAPVMVRRAETGWERRHFAGVGKDGRPMTWESGRTSFTTEDPPISWYECRRPTEEDMRA